MSCEYHGLFWGPLNITVRNDYQRMSGRIVNVQMFLIFEKALGNNF